MRRVADIMTTELIAARANDLVGEIRDRMLDTGVHMIPVVDDSDHPVGVVSSWDLVEEYQPEEGIQNAMTTRVECIGRSATIQEAAIRMRESFLHHLIVVDDADHIVGVVSSFDLIGELV